MTKDYIFDSVWRSNDGAFQQKTPSNPHTVSAKSYQKNSAPCAQQGFTLVELLVAMALLSLVMLGMASALGSMAQLETRVDARLEQLDEFRTATGFVGQVLGRASARRMTSGTPKLGETPFLFRGEPQSLTWLGVMPARHGAGGLHFFRLAIEQNGGGSALVLRFIPWNGEETLPDWTGSDARALVQGVTQLALQYEDARQPSVQWVSQWSSPLGLPQRVRIDLTTDSGPWPLWIVPLRTLPGSQGAKGRFSAGPGE